MSNSVIASDVFVAGSLSSRTFTPPSGSITNDSIAGSAGIAASKLVHRFPVTKRIAGTVGSVTEIIHIHHAGATVAAVDVLCGTHPTSSDTVTVDLKRGSASVSYTSVLSGVVTLNSSSANKTPYSGTITSATSVTADSLQVVITASGSSCADLVVSIWIEELPA
jgi:hypothetical protein